VPRLRVDAKIDRRCLGAMTCTYRQFGENFGEHIANLAEEMIDILSVWCMQGQ